MPGGTTNHNEIALNFCTNFKFTMRGKNYKFCELRFEKNAEKINIVSGEFSIQTQRR